MSEPSGQQPDIAALSRLLARQFPELADLSIRLVDPPGWDNAVFRIGDALVAKFPRDAAYASQPERECSALDELAGQLPLATPVPYGIGRPSADFPHPFSILHWIDGEVMKTGARVDLGLAIQLADFLVALHTIAHSTASRPSSKNFWRGGQLACLWDDLVPALECLSGTERRKASALWEAACAMPFDGPDVRIHGDIAPANLVLRDGTLVGIIDFGLSVAGDPACDLAICWLAMESDAREAFLGSYGGIGAGLTLRAAAWALWKATLMMAGRTFTPPGYRHAPDILASVFEVHESLSC